MQCMTLMLCDDEQYRVPCGRCAYLHSSRISSLAVSPVIISNWENAVDVRIYPPPSFWNNMMEGPNMLLPGQSFLSVNSHMTLSEYLPGSTFSMM